MVYQNGINGLRGIAVLAVVLFHLGFTFASGGFAGVDVFLVVSGYLITSLIQEKSKAGYFSVFEFFMARLRRIYPALLCVVIVCAVPATLVLTPDAFTDFSKSAVYALLSVANYNFYFTTGYFGETAELQPLLHLWSLGVEMQFYLVWPILVLILIRLLRTGWGAVRLAAVFIAIVSFALGVIKLNTDPSMVFYFTPYRLWEFMLGSILAVKVNGDCLISLKGRRVTEFAGFLGLTLLFHSFLTLDKGQLFPGFNAVLPAIGAALVIWSGERQGRIANSLNYFPIGFLGNLSFSIYLWHWPIISFVRHYNNSDQVSGWQIAFVVGMTLVLSYCSWRWIEQPFRKKIFSAPNKIIGGVVVSAIGLFTVAIIFKPTPNPSVAPISNLDAMWQWDCPRSANFEGVGALCVVGGDWKSSPHHAMVWGDSHAQHLLPLIDIAAKKHGVAVVYFPGCAPDLNTIKISEAKYQLGCVDARVSGLNILKSTPEIENVLLVGAYSLHMPLLYKEESDKGDLEKGAEYVVEGIEDLIEHIRPLNRHMVVVRDIPRFEVSPVPCIIGERLGLLRRPCDSRSLVTLGDYKAYSASLDERLKSLSSQSDVSVFIPAETLCSETGCLREIDGELLYRDYNHLRRNLPQATKERLIHLLGIENMLVPTSKNSGITTL